MRKYVGGALIILLIMALLLPGCSSGKSGSNTNPGSTTTNPSNSKAIVITFTVNTVTQIKGYYMTNTAKDGDVYIVLETTIENHSNDAFNIDPMNFYVIAGGISYRQAMLLDIDNAIQLGVVKKADTLKGKLVFEVPAGTTDFTMEYHGDKSYNIQWVKQ
ncbi:MAG: DUF4352 domain-containing protein [Dehalococcoidales bacterium]|jgi:hypothetical protein